MEELCGEWPSMHSGASQILVWPSQNQLGRESNISMAQSKSVWARVKYYLPGEFAGVSGAFGRLDGLDFVL